jgi:hypothetical protein
MGPTAIVTLIGVGLVVAVLAIYLISVAALLTRVSSMLNTIIDRLWGISESAQPLGGAFGDMNRDLAAARQTMDQFVHKKVQQRRAQAQAPAEAQAEAATQGSSGGGSRSSGRSRKGTARKGAGRRAGSRQ